MGLFKNRKNHPPVWFMRQAGRYHKHYQGYRAKHDFMTMCKTPQLACEITMGPIEDFDFDAAILFSDLLFPLEQMGTGLTYQNGPPELKHHLKTLEDFKRLKVTTPAREYYTFQKEALSLIRKELHQDKTLLGFVGSPFTLFTYAVEGSHKGSLTLTKEHLYSGLWDQFNELLLPELIDNMIVQAEGGADAVCIMDTAAGELSLYDYRRFVLPKLKIITNEFRRACPNTKVIYYSKMTHLHYFEELRDLPIDGLGVDWRLDLNQTLKEFGNRFYIQGNLDPSWMFLKWEDLESNLKIFFNDIKDNPHLDHHIFGLGHGMLPKALEENVQKTVQYVHSL